MLRTYSQKTTVYSKSLRKNMTPWERHLWYDFLRTYSVKFYRQRSFGRYIVDFFCRKAMLALELDGSEHFSEDKKLFDVERTAYLEEFGLQVVRISNYDIDRNFYGVCIFIDNLVKKRMLKETHSTASGPPLPNGEAQVCSVMK